ncbi:MAG: hypothetical protein AABN34_19800 [Acidobacteriota bacterium]
MKPSPLNVHEVPPESNRGLRAEAAPGIDRDTLVVELQDRIAKLNEQSRIFIPLIALVLIASMPVWSKSPARFLLLLLSPFVLLPLGFCIAHLLLAWRRIAIARSRIQEWDMINARGKR